MRGMNGLLTSAFYGGQSKHDDSQSSDPTIEVACDTSIVLLWSVRPTDANAPDLESRHRCGHTWVNWLQSACGLLRFHPMKVQCREHVVVIAVSVDDPGHLRLTFRIRTCWSFAHVRTHCVCLSVMSTQYRRFFRSGKQAGALSSLQRNL